MNGAFRFNIPSVINTSVTSREVRTGVTTSVVEEFSETRADRVVSTNIAQTMRARDIAVTGENFRPGSPYYIFFDGIDVNEYVTPAGQAIGTTLKADDLGAISATFAIPNTTKLNFSTGSKTLKITDSSTNDPDSTSQGTAQYAANGEIKVMQEEIISTRTGRIVLEELSESRMTTSVERRVRPNPVNWVDPLAQSFLVDVAGGIFVTSVELYFAAKDTSLPVSVQLRHMENGFPTQKILPFGEKTLSPSSVNVTSDASTSTKFVFPSPVFLEAGNEYCIVVMTNSNVYTAWVSEMGGRDIQTNDFIDQQPYAGSLFKSQNNSTWTPDQMRDLKMTLNRAKFTTGTSANIVFENSAIAADTLGSDPIETVLGTKTFRVYHYSHGNYDQSKSNITIAGVEGDRSGSVFSFSDDTVALASGTLSNGTYTAVAPSSDDSPNGSGLTVTMVVASDATTSLTIVNPGQNYLVGETVTFTNQNSQTNSLVLTIAAVKETLGGIPIEYINTTHSAGTSASGATSSAKIMSDIDEYLITIPDATWPARTSGTATSPNYQGSTESTSGGGENVTATPNIYFDALHTMVPSVELPNTTILPTFLATSATQATYLASPAASYTKDTSSTTITLNDNNFLSTPKIVASGINESSEMGSVKSFSLTTQLSSTANNVSPVLDIDTIGSIAIQNRINNIDSTTDVESGTFVPASLAKGDNNAAIYMTKKIQLENPANAIHVLFDGYKAPDASGTNPQILVYYKVMGPDDNLQFNDMGWTSATIKATVQSDATDFKEHTYEIESLEDFTAFSIKVVLQSVNSSNVPLIENFRAIALST